MQRADSPWLWVHPVLGVVAVLLTLAVLRSGLRSREQKLRRRAGQAEPSLLRPHVRWGPVAVAAMAAAALAGVLSGWLGRGWTPLSRTHGWFGVLATTVLVGQLLLGQRLRRAPGPWARAHGLAGLLGLFVACLAAISGIEWLP